MKFIKENLEEIEAVIGVLLVGGHLLGIVPLEVLVPILGLLSATATHEIKQKLKKAGSVANHI